jgi:queuine tRNA-ribosyltransferase
MRGAVRTRSAVEQIIERTSPWLLRRHPFLGATFSSSPSDDDEGPSTSFKPDQTERRRRKGHPAIDPLTPPPPASEFPPYEPRDFFRYELIHQSKKSAARVGRIHTPHGVIETPGFVAVGTNGALKAVPHQELAAAGVDLMFANTYHLMLQPGPDLVASAGGLHEFIGRDAPIITDSGGFQVFSLARPNAEDGLEMKSRRATKQKGEDGLLIRSNEHGVLFRSYRDGSSVVLTPESSVEAQKNLGADIIIPLDELPPYHIDRAVLERSVFLSHRWEARSLKAHLRDVRMQAMYAVIHGGVDKDLRRMSAEYLTSLPFDGFAIGGSLGKNTAELVELLAHLMPRIPKDRPNHLLGIGDVGSILGSIPHGVDTFDSTFPTRNARHGQLMTRTRGTFNIQRAENASIHEPVCHQCACSLCRDHTVSYLHHLFRANEPTAVTLATAHNLHYMGWLMQSLREKILNDEL